MPKATEKTVPATVTPVTENATAILRGALRKERRKAERKAKREARQKEKKGTKVSRGVLFYSKHDVASNVRALRGDRATHYAAQLDVCREAIEATRAKLAACGLAADIEGMQHAAAQLTKLQANAAHIEAKAKDGAFTEEDADALDVAVAMQCVAMLRSFRIYVEPNATESNAAKLGVIANESTRKAIRSKLAELLEVCVTNNVFPEIGKR
jgi:hypothetical protein